MFKIADAKIANAVAIAFLFESRATDLVADDDNAEQDIFLAWGPAMVMADGFETSDTSLWSTTVPDPGL